MDEDIKFVTINGRIVPIKPNHLYEESQRWSKSLTSTELHSIRKYTKNSLETGDEKNSNKFYAKLNEYLRCKQKGIGLYDEFYEKYSKSISSAIGKFNLKESVVCYRGSNYDESNGTKEGAIFTNPSFSSTSINVNNSFSGKYKYIIEVPPRVRCAYLGNISRYRKQKELLIDKETKYMVLSRQGNYIKLRVIV